MTDDVIEQPADGATAAANAATSGTSGVAGSEGGDQAAGNGVPEPEQRGRLRRWTAWVFTRHLCFGGLVGALVLFCLSMTPSLVPRAWLFQGAVSGVSVAIGYGVGSAVSAVIRKLVKREPSPVFKRRAWWVLAGSTLVMGALFLYFGWAWQEDVRQLMEIDDLRAFEWLSLIHI